MFSSCGAVGGPFMSCGHFPGGKKQYYNEGRKRLTKTLMFIFNCCKKKSFQVFAIGFQGVWFQVRFCSFSDMPDRSAPYTMQTQELRRMVLRNSHLLR
ncbi:unnamed protein product [Sphagnum jensenii]|uniref:NADH-plastoquinone oxidoreductase subunit K n=1 Tax=Sphagnum jensenii TaxID=128206 RepID=A0ABP1AVP7_9BRYO